jgi:hypothetical protein
MECKIGSFNLYNLVLPDHVYYHNRKYSKNEYDKKTDWIKRQITKMDAQIIGFQEVFHKQALIEALKGTCFKAKNIHVFGESGNSPVVGLASSLPVLSISKPITDIPSEVYCKIEGLSEDNRFFSRPVIKLRIALNNNVVITVFVCHLKSKRPIFLDCEDENEFNIYAVGQTRALIKRSVEAAGLRQIILRELSENNDPVIVIGDLNDSTRSVTNNIIAGPLPWKLDSIKEKKRHWDTVLYNCFDIIAQKSFKKEWYTHIYNGHYETLDHIYISQEFFFKNRNRIGNVDFTHVLKDHLMDTTLAKDNIPKWQSDHGQVVVSLSLKK